ncbi:Sec1-like protein [Wallemia mellicola]|uniref:Sec1-like protein n=1 Tax=Wallemia mellicola TaxID=1708541 RepID=A0AB38MS13_9BASI|nr:Sec1-like protein [Wallemia mellicola]
MNVIEAVNNYINKLVNEVKGMKVLLLDDSTTSYLSAVTTQTQLLSSEVYLTDRVENLNRERISHLKCIVYLSPTANSIKYLSSELSNPKYQEYFLYFSNTLTKQQIEQLAESDQYSVVRECQELFADYLALLPNLFSLGFQPTKDNLWSDTPNTWNRDCLDSTTKSLSALLLSLKRKPLIRYEKMSDLAKTLAESVSTTIDTESQLFDFRLTQSQPVLLICDRRNDPVTPLLTQWTYQAMVHDLIGLDNGKVDLSQAPNIQPQQKQLILSVTNDNDSFYTNNLFANFGDLGANVKQYVSEYQTATTGKGTTADNIQTISDMKKFIESYPEMRKLGSNVSKHVSLIGELSRLVDEKKLLQVSELEQSLASNESHSSDLRAVREMIDSPDIPQESKVRIAILYALRYQKLASNAITAVVGQLLQQGVPQHRVALIYVMLNLAGADKRQDDLFMNDNFFSRGRSALKGLQGVENVYTQHTPHLSETVDLLLKGRLREGSYPGVNADGGSLNQRPQEVIVFMIGGTTYEEARSMAVLNETMAREGSPTRVLLGGHTVLNSTQFLDMLAEAATHFPPSVYSAPPSSQNQNQLFAVSEMDQMLDPERMASAAKSWMQRVREDIEDRIMI